MTTIKLDESFFLFYYSTSFEKCAHASSNFNSGIFNLYFQSRSVHFVPWKNFFYLLGTCVKMMLGWKIYLNYWASGKWRMKLANLNWTSFNWPNSLLNFRCLDLAWSAIISWVFVIQTRMLKKIMGWKKHQRLSMNVTIVFFYETIVCPSYFFLDHVSWTIPKDRIFPTLPAPHLVLSAHLTDAHGITSDLIVALHFLNKVDLHIIRTTTTIKYTQDEHCFTFLSWWNWES